MRTKLDYCLLLPFTASIAIFILAARDVEAQGPPPAANNRSMIGGAPVSEILERLGASMEHGVTTRQLNDYFRHFKLIDLDGDGQHSKVEYIEKGRYMTPQARRGIFAAADNNGDGSVTDAEYTLNRIITDEGKAIVQAMDDDGDGAIQAAEFTAHATAKLEDAKLAGQVFAALDTDGDKEIRVPEYLRVWGKWARIGQEPPEERIAARESELLAAGKDQDKGEATPKEAGENSRPSRPGGRPGGGGPPSVDIVFQRFDDNKDGNLSADEIPEFAKQFILPADSNKDGSVTKEELQKHRENGAGKLDHETENSGTPTVDESS